MATSDSALAADLVREFLEHFELHSSLAVMIPEGNLDAEYPGRAPLAMRLGLDDTAGASLEHATFPANISRKQNRTAGAQHSMAVRATTLTTCPPEPPAGDPLLVQLIRAGGGNAPSANHDNTTPQRQITTPTHTTPKSAPRGSTLPQSRDPHTPPSPGDHDVDSSNLADSPQVLPPQ